MVMVILRDMADWDVGSKSEDFIYVAHEGYVIVSALIMDGKFYSEPGQMELDIGDPDFAAKLRKAMLRNVTELLIDFMSTTNPDAGWVRQKHPALVPALKKYKDQLGTP